MEKHHQKAIDSFVEVYSKDNTILAILLGGSIAHGFEVSDSDIDVVLVVESGEYQKRKKNNSLAFSLRDICDYPNGYIDCKVADLGFLIKIKERGSDPVRFAFNDNKILYSKIENLDILLYDISHFPHSDYNERKNRFASQLLAWKWYYSEAVKKRNKYLVYLSIQKIVLFAGRLVLNENRLLYPYHKWLLKVLESAASKPNNLMEKINILFDDHSLGTVNNFCNEIFDFIGFNEKSVDWPNYFLKDSEQTWIEHEPPIDDI